MVCTVCFLLQVVVILHTYLISVDTFQVDKKCECGQRKLLHAYMINGKDAESTEHPWLATIYYQPEDYLCGGSIITDKHILTAAHCFPGFSYANLYARLGQQSRNPIDGEIHLFRKLIIHPSYKILSFDATDDDNVGAANDIAIATLADRIKFHIGVWPICLNDINSNFIEQPALFAGWGSVACQDKLATHLQEGEIFISKPEVCRHTDIGSVFNSSIMLCTYANHASPFSGDSGGPLVYDTNSGYIMQIGIVSFSDRCFENATTVFTKVAAYNEWIMKNTKKGKTCKIPL